MATDVTQTSIPFLRLRGGSSRGPYFRKSDLPTDREVLTEVLLSAVNDADGTADSEG